MVPFGDHQIEQEHKPLCDVARHGLKVIHGHRFATQRLKYVERQFDNPTCCTRLVDAYLKLHTTRSMISALGFEKHPVFRDWYQASGDRSSHSSHKMLAVLQSIVYRTNISIKYERHTVAKRISEPRDKANAAKLTAKVVVAQTIPTSVEHLLLQNSGEHLRAVASTYAMLTMPERTDGEVRLVTQAISKMLYPDEGGEDNKMEGNQANDVGEDIDAAEGLSDDEDHEVELAMQIAVAAPIAHAPDVKDDSPSHNCMCFKVLSSSIGRLKTLSTFIQGVGPKLAQADMAITMHQGSVDADGNLVVDVRPRPTDGQETMYVSICTSFVPGCPLESLIRSVQGWGSQGKAVARFSLPIDNIDPLELHSVLDNLLTKQAVVYRDHVVIGDASREPWLPLLEHGFVKAKDLAATAESPETQGFQLSREGLHALKTHTLLTQSR